MNQEGDVQRYGGLQAIKKDETIFAAYDKAEMRKAKIMIVANSDFVHTSKSLFWSDVIMLAAVDLDLTQSVSMAIGVQRQTDMNPITIVFAGINDHLQSKGFLSRLREPTTAEAAVWPAIKDILESMGEVTFAFPDVKMEAYRRSVLHLNLISAVDGSVLNWCEQHVLRELMSEDLLFGKISEPEMTTVIFDDHFRDRMGEMERGHIEVFPKLWNLRPYVKMNGEITRIPPLTTAYHKVRDKRLG